MKNIFKNLVPSKRIIMFAYLDKEKTFNIIETHIPNGLKKATVNICGWTNDWIVLTMKAGDRAWFEIMKELTAEQVRIRNEPLKIGE